MSVNTFVVSGIARDNATPCGKGEYYKVVVDLYNKKADRNEPVELLGRTEEFRSIARGNYVCIQGAVGGRINDKGFCNITLFAIGVEVLGEPAPANYGDTDNDEPPY